ncbi:unnamed protein product [Scytosiphon promiscuus]
MADGPWLSLMIGNSRLHWAVLEIDNVVEAWDTGHLGTLEATCSTAGSAKVEEGIPSSFMPKRARDLIRRGHLVSNSQTDATLPYSPTNLTQFRVASVVPEELERWRRRCPGISPILSGDVLDGVTEYPTLGVDRALAVRGAARVRGWPVVVVDCGSALTFTAADAKGKLAGGAILPGVRLQLAALGTRTAQLPSGIVLPEELPPRQVSLGTAGGIQAGVMWTIVAGIHSFIKDRWNIDPDVTVVFTGGDGQVLHRAVLDSWESEEQEFAHLRHRIHFVGDVIHWGIASLALEGSRPSIDA